MSIAKKYNGCEERRFKSFFEPVHKIAAYLAMARSGDHYPDIPLFGIFLCGKISSAGGYTVFSLLNTLNYSIEQVSLGYSAAIDK